MTGRTVGHYELGRTLGEGTFAKASAPICDSSLLTSLQVKIAKDVQTQTLYAMKIFSRSDLTGEVQRKIRDEIAVLKHVRHPSVVNLHEVLASKTHVYIVLELITGGELFDRIATSGTQPAGRATHRADVRLLSRKAGRATRARLLPAAHRRRRILPRALQAPAVRARR